MGAAKCADPSTRPRPAQWTKVEAITRPGDAAVPNAADSEDIEARTRIRTCLTAALVCLAVLVVAAPAGAKGGPPVGKGGPPPWGGGGKAKVHQAKGAAKKVEHAARKAEKAAKKAEQARERGGELNPAMTCFGLLAEMGVGFYEHYGTNPNQANAFGKCVSEHAQAKGEGEDGEAEEPADCEAPEEEPSDPTTLDEGDEPGEGEEPADDCAPAEEPAECEAPAEEPPAEDGTAEDPDSGDECVPAEEEPSEPEDADAGASFELTCFAPRPHANPFALCL